MSASKIENPHQPPEPEMDDYPHFPEGRGVQGYKESPVYKLDPPEGGFDHQDTQWESINPDEAVFSQLKKSAEAQGRPDMVGMEWVEADGMRYRVSSYEQLTRTRQEVKKTRLPRIAKHSINGPEIERPERATGNLIKEKVDYRTVDVINPDGEIVDILTFNGARREWIPRTAYGPFKAKAGVTGRAVKPKQYKDVDLFEAHFSDKHGSPRDVVGFRWTEQPEKPIKPVGRVNAPVIDTREHHRDPKLITPAERTQQLFEALAEQQAQLGLDDWRGLTWNDPRLQPVRDEKGRWVVKNSSRLQIIRDEVVMKKDELSGDTYLERMFEVRTAAGDGTPTQRHIYTLNELWEHFKRKEESDRKLDKPRAKAVRSGDKPDELEPPLRLDLHWETPYGSASEAPTQLLPQLPAGPEHPLARWYREEELAWQGLIPGSEAWATTQPIPAVEKNRNIPHLTVEDAMALLYGYGDDVLEIRPTFKDRRLATAYERMSDSEKTTENRKALVKFIGEAIHTRDNRALTKEERKRDHIAQKSRLHERANELLRTAKDVGFERLYDVVEEMRMAFIESLPDQERLGIEIDKLPRRYFKKMADSEILTYLMERSLHGEQGLFDDDPAGRMKRMAYFENELGWVFVHNALRPEKHKVPDPESEDGKKTAIIRVDNHDVLGRIRYLLDKTSIEKMLDAERKNTEGRSALDHDDFTTIGHMLRRSIGRV